MCPITLTNNITPHKGTTGEISREKRQKKKFGESGLVGQISSLKQGGISRWKLHAGNQR